MSDFVNAFQALELKWKCPGRRHPDSDKKSEEQKEEVLATPTKVDEARYSVIHVYFIVGKFESYMHVTNILRKKCWILERSLVKSHQFSLTLFHKQRYSTL